MVHQKSKWETKGSKNYITPTKQSNGKRGWKPALIVLGSFSRFSPLVSQVFGSCCVGISLSFATRGWNPVRRGFGRSCTTLIWMRHKNDECVLHIPTVSFMIVCFPPDFVPQVFKSASARALLYWMSSTKTKTSPVAAGNASTFRASFSLQRVLVGPWLMFVKS